MGIFNQSTKHPIDEARDKYIEIINDTFDKFRRIFVSPSEMEGYLTGEISQFNEYFQSRGIQYIRVHVYSNKYHIKKRFNVLIKVKVSDSELYYPIIDIDV